MTDPKPTTNPIPALPASSGPSAPTDPTADSTGTERPPITLDNALLNGAEGDTDIWGGELSRFLADLTGKTIDPGSLSAILGAFGMQVQSQTYKVAAVAVANYPIEAKGHSVSALLGVMDFRADAAAQLLSTVTE